MITPLKIRTVSYFILSMRHLLAEKICARLLETNNGKKMR